jgi:hypothetical protein
MSNHIPAEMRIVWILFRNSIKSLIVLKRGMLVCTGMVSKIGCQFRPSSPEYKVVKSVPTVHSCAPSPQIAVNVCVVPLVCNCQHSPPVDRVQGGHRA